MSQGSNFSPSDVPPYEGKSLSRKIKSCEACRKMKIKCVFDSPESKKCTRCITRGLQCQLNKSLQSILDDDLVWKHDLEASLQSQQDQIVKLQLSLDQVLHKLDTVPSVRSKRNSCTDDNSLAAEASSYLADEYDSSRECNPNQGLDQPQLGPSKRRKLSVDASQLPDPVKSRYQFGLDSRLSPKITGDSASHDRLAFQTKAFVSLNPAATADALSESNNPSSSVPLQDSVLPLRAAKQMETDVISRRILTLQQAERLLTIYLEKMDRQLYHVLRMSYFSDPLRKPDAKLEPLVVHQWLQQLRHSSSLLLLAILTVAALHTTTSETDRGGAAAISSHPYPIVYREFVKLAATLSFSRQQTLDDIRALVIGAYWLPDISWILVGTAVRVATERGLHLSYKSTPPPVQPACCTTTSPKQHTTPNQEELAQATNAYHEARVYFMIYVVDHHASIPHGRPPMTRQHSVIRSCYQWLGRCCSSHGIRIDDQRLISQVKLWEILHDVIDEMGSDVHQPLDAQSLLVAQKFASQLKLWLDESLLRISWCISTEPQLDSRRYLSELKVSYSFAYLFLESSAFRAPHGQVPDFIISNDVARTNQTVHDKKLMAQRALKAAKCVLVGLDIGSSSDKVILQGDDLQYASSYIYSMVISAIVFIAKVHEILAGSSTETSLEGCTLVEALDLIQQCLEQLQKLSSFHSDQHIVTKMVDGTKVLISQLKQRPPGLVTASRLATSLTTSIPEQTDLISSPLSRSAIPIHALASASTPLSSHGRFAYTNPTIVGSASLTTTSTANHYSTANEGGSGGGSGSGSCSGDGNHNNKHHHSSTNFAPTWGLNVPPFTTTSLPASVDTFSSTIQTPLANAADVNLANANQPTFTIDEFDLLSDMRPLSGLDFWPDILYPSIISPHGSI